MFTMQIYLCRVQKIDFLFYDVFVLYYDFQKASWNKKNTKPHIIG